MPRDILPDSRLKTKVATIIGPLPIFDWITGRIRVIRWEWEPIFCMGDCGRQQGYTPRGLMSFVSWFCAECSEKYGSAAQKMACSDQEFWDKLRDEMHASYGVDLTGEQLQDLAMRGKLSHGLELLERESPYRTMMAS